MAPQRLAAPPRPLPPNLIVHRRRHISVRLPRPDQPPFQREAETARRVRAASDGVAGAVRRRAHPCLCAYCEGRHAAASAAESVDSLECVTMRCCGTLRSRLICSSEAEKGGHIQWDDVENSDNGVVAPDPTFSTEKTEEFLVRWRDMCLKLGIDYSCVSPSVDVGALDL